MQLWCAILPHAETQLNVLRKSATKPSISAFEHINDPHNYDSHPFAILGSAVEIHVMPANRRTWAAHTKPGFYLGPSWEHYRCHDVWVEETRATRTGQTVFFRNKYITQPTVTAADALVRTGEDLCSALTGSTPDSDATRRAVDSLMEIFKTKAAEEQTPTDAQRVLKTVAHAQRVANEAQTDNTTALGFVTKNLNPKATKSTDMNNWYMRDKQDQQQFRYYWREGKRNNADYQTKHFCPAHHQEKRFNYLTRRDIVDSLRMRQGKTALIF